MTQWDDKYKEHPVHTTLSNLQDILDNDALVSEDVSVIGSIDRIRQATEYAATSLQNVIPPIFNNSTLNNINSYLQSIINEVNAYISNKNAANLNNTVAHVDNLTSQIASLTIPRPILTGKSFTSSAIAYRKQLEEIVEEISESKNDLLTQIKEIANKSTEQATQLEEISVLIEQHQNQITESINNFQKQFDESESEYTEKLSKHVEEKNEEISNFIEELKQKHEELVAQHEQAASTLLANLESKKNEAANIVQIIGNIGVTGNYQKIAIEEQRAANKWRNIAVLLMLTMVVIIAATVFISIEDGFDWKIAAFRIIAALILGVPAAYAARESEKHRSNETHNRSAELQLASLDPYLEKFPDEQKNQIKEKLTDKFFGLESQEKHNNEPVTYNALIDLIKLAIKEK